MTPAIKVRTAMYKCNTCTLVYFDFVTVDEELLKVLKREPCPDCKTNDELTIKWR